MIEGGFFCGEELEYVFFCVLFFYLWVGCFDEVKIVYLCSYCLVKDNFDNFCIVVNNIVFVVIIGNEVCVFVLVEKYIVWFVYDGLNVDVYFVVFVVFVVVLDCVMVVGYGDILVCGVELVVFVLFFGEYDGMWSVVDFVVVFWVVVEWIGVVFDECDGIDGYVCSLEWMCVFVDEQYDVLICFDVFVVFVMFFVLVDVDVWFEWVMQFVQFGVEYEMFEVLLYVFEVVDLVK